MHSLSTSTVFPSESESMQAQSNSLVFIYYCMYCTVYLLSPSYRSMMAEPDLNGPLLFFLLWVSSFARICYLHKIVTIV